MPFDKVALAAMSAVEDEFVNKEQIGERFGVTIRTVERLTETYAKVLKKHRRRKGRTVEYLLSEVLRCAKIYTGIEKENGPSASMKREYTKQRILELEAEIEQLRNYIDHLRGENVHLKQLLNSKNAGEEK